MLRGISFPVLAEKRSSSRARPNVNGFDWKVVGGGKSWKLADTSGAHAAEIVADGNLWRWTVIVPAWYRNVGNPTGKVRTLEDAKAVCEAILRGTILEWE
jgi:hypothetical protein